LGFPFAMQDGGMDLLSMPVSIDSRSQTT